VHSLDLVAPTVQDVKRLFGFHAVRNFRVLMR
jgi:hypothetical protein